MIRTTRTLLALLALAAGPPTAAAEDWPAQAGDVARSRVSSARLDFESLREAWDWRSPQPPAPAWPKPAKWDAYAGLRGMKSMRNYDPVFHTTIAGGRVYFGSSADDAVRCLDAGTGDVLWSFITGGPVRVAPQIHEGRAYVGSDDGAAYCLDASSGAQVWRFSPAPDAPLVLNNGRVISTLPIRTGVLVDGGTAYLGASLLPWGASRLAAVDAATGEPVGAGRYVRTYPAGKTLEGPLLTTDTQLIAPQGRVAPILIDRATGDPAGSLPGGGGSFVLLTRDESVLHGPGNKAGWITDSSSASRAKIASYERGNAIVVADGVAYMLSDAGLGAMDRATRTPVWAVESSHPYAMIVTPDAIVAGGYDEVAAYARRDGALLWTAPVDGRAYGLAAADGRLFVSTDRGAIHAFGPDGDGAGGAPGPATPDGATPTDGAGGVPPRIRALRDPALLDRFVFQSDMLEGDAAVRNLARDHAARLASPARIARLTPDVHALILDGRTTGVGVEDDFTAAPVPARALTAEAWVRIDQPIEWGGVVGVTQDNGAYERGWILGYRQDRFGMAVAAEQGDGRLTWVTSPEAFTPGEWRHVAGTYDGTTIRLFVDGREVASSGVQRGDVRYPEHARYHIGAYYDDDEHFRMKGMLHEVRVYERALGADEVAAHHRAKADAFPSAPTIAPARGNDDVVQDPLLGAGPFMRFVGPGRAEVTWEAMDRTRRDALLVTIDGRTTRRDAEVVRGVRPGAPRPVRAATAGRRVVLDGLETQRIYTLRIETGEGDGRRLTRAYELDTFFDYTTPDWPEGGPEREAPAWLAGVGEIGPGVAVLLGAGRVEEALALAGATRLRVIVLEPDALRASFARRVLEGAGVHGARVSVLDADACDARLPSAFANLIVAGDDAALSDECLIDRLVPGRGRLLVVRDGGVRHERIRDPLEGAAGWTHMYGAPDNSAFAGETLAGAGRIDEMDVQWIGRPGPRYQSDRQNRKPAPLSSNGRLFMQGLNRIIAVDAFNGAILWSLELPTMQRFNIPRDCANWCADGDVLYVAMADRLWAIDAPTGAFRAPAAGGGWAHQSVAPHAGGPGAEWGYCAVQDGLIIGSAVRPGAMYTDWWGGGAWYDAKAGEGAGKVCSDALFALEDRDARPRWRYDEPSVIVNPTITIHDGRVYFVECRDPAVVAGEGRRLNDEAFWADQHLTALDLETGRAAWSRPLDMMDGVTAMYAAAAGDAVVVSTSAEGKFHVAAFGASDGGERWRRPVRWEADHHGKHLARPAILNGRVYLRPAVLDLATGDEIPALKFPPGHQCGAYAASSNALFLRAGDLAMWDQRSGDATRWTRTRPDCWLSTIPAAGLLLSPEGGGGCSCGSWIETSFAMIPKKSRLRK